MNLIIKDGYRVIAGTCGEDVEYEIRDGKMTVRYTGNDEHGGVMSPTKEWYFDDSKGKLVRAPWRKRGEAKVTQVKFINIAKVLEGAFKGSYVEYVEFTGHVEEIGAHAFDDCKKLRGVACDDGVGRIGDYAFYACTEFKYAYLPDMTYIGKYAFTGCRVGDLDLSNVTYIGDYAFLCNGYVGGNGKLELSKAKIIGTGAFCDTWVSEVVLRDDISRIKAYTFKNCHLKKVTIIGNKYVKIGKEAFKGNYLLHTVFIGGTVLKVGRSAFSGVNEHCDFTINTLFELVIAKEDAFGSGNKIKTTAFESDGKVEDDIDESMLVRSSSEVNAYKSCVIDDFDEFESGEVDIEKLKERYKKAK